MDNFNAMKFDDIKIGETRLIITGEPFAKLWSRRELLRVRG